MASIVKEFFWGCQLSKDKREHQWDSEDEKLSKLDIDQKLLLSNACLGAEVKENEQNLIEVTTTDVSENTATFTIVSLKKGSTEQCRLNLTFPSTALFTLVKGSGPVHLVGSVYQELYLSESDESESEEGEDSVTKTSQVSSKKRPLVSDTPKGPPKKQARLEKENDKEMESGDDDDEDDDGEDENDDEDETSNEESKKTPELTPKAAAAGKKAIANLIDNKESEEGEESEDDESEEEDEGDSDEEESEEGSEDGSDDDDDEEIEDEESEDEESEDEVAASLAAKKKETGKGRKKPVSNGVGKPKVGKKIEQEKQVHTPKQQPSTPKGKTPEVKKSGGKMPQTPNTNEIKEKLLKTPNLPKKVEKFKNYMKSSFKMTDNAAVTEIWDWLQKNKK